MNASLVMSTLKRRYGDMSSQRVGSNAFCPDRKLNFKSAISSPPSSSSSSLLREKNVHMHMHMHHDSGDEYAHQHKKRRSNAMQLGSPERGPTPSQSPLSNHPSSRAFAPALSNRAYASQKVDELVSYKRKRKEVRMSMREEERKHSNRNAMDTDVDGPSSQGSAKRAKCTLGAQDVNVNTKQQGQGQQGQGQQGKKLTLTEDKWKEFLAQAMQEREENLKIEFSHILQTKMNDLFQQFAQFNKDHVSMQVKSEDFFYVS